MKNNLIIFIISSILLIGFISASPYDSGLIHYWNFNEGTGTNANDVRGVEIGQEYDGLLTNAVFSTDCINGGCVKLDGTGDFINVTGYTGEPSATNNFTIVIWVNTSSSATAYNLLANDINPYTAAGTWSIDNNVATALTGYTGASLTKSSTFPKKDNRWSQVIFIGNDTGTYLYLNGTSVSGNGTHASITSGRIFFGCQRDGSTWCLNGMLDEIGIWNRSITPSEVSELWNNGNGLFYGITLNSYLVSPTNNSKLSSNIITFKANFTYSTYNISNATYYVYNETGLFNKTTVALTPANNNSMLNISGFKMGSYLWDVYSCYTNSTSTFCMWGVYGNYSFEWRPFEINSQTYTQNVLETSRQRFELNITTLSTILSISSKINYNGTYYNAITSCNSGLCNIYKYLDIPLVQSGETANKSFYWNITIFDGISSYSFNTLNEIQYQNSSRIHLEICNSSYNTLVLNFTAYDEKNLTSIINFDIGGTFSSWIGTGSIRRNFSFSNKPTNSTALCMYQNYTLYSDAQIEYYTSDINTSSYVKRNYFFQSEQLSNVSRNIGLYLLLSEYSTSFIQKVQDQKLSNVKNALIFTERYYPYDGTYKIVQVSKTDDNGESIGFYEVENADYKHIIMKDGILLLETSKQKVIGKEVPFTLTFTTGVSSQTPWSYWEGNSDIMTYIFYNKTTNIVKFSYVDSNNEINFARLLVIKESSSNSSYQVICNVTSEQSSAEIICNMSGYSGNFIAKGYIIDDNTLAKIIDFIVTTTRDIMGNSGLILGFFIILTSGFAFIWNPVAGIVGINASLWLVSFIGFITFSPIFLFSIMGVSIIAIILLKT